MGKARGNNEERLARGYAEVDRAIHNRDVGRAISVARASSAFAEKIKDFYTYHDFDLTSKALESGHVDLDSCVVDREAFLRENGRYCGVEEYLLERQKESEGACPSSSDSLLSVLTRSSYSFLLTVLIGVGVLGIGLNINGNVVGFSSDGLPLGVLFLVLGLVGLYFQVRRN